MNYTIENLENDISDIITELAEMRKAKGKDYSGMEDTLDNLRGFGSFGVVVRIGDKFKRLKHFYKQGVLAVENEKIEDTMKDLINYSLYLLIMWRQEGKEEPMNKKDAEIKQLKAENERYEAAVGFVMVLEDVESIKEILQPLLR